ncbi:MAG: glycosyltransferase [Flavobacteriales bacterium]|nr:MAG: glycosyltransferase [Flavobacteriales bacterium]
MRILHIAGWYPHPQVPGEALFVERHVRSLSGHAEAEVWHIDVRPSPGWKLTRRGLRADRTLLLHLPLHRWLIIEWIATALILWAWLTRDRSRPIDAVNFHIAYPNCARIRLLRRIMQRPMVITEHYSAYRIGFNATGRGVARIKAIFHAGAPVIAVSRALAADITRFAGPPAPVMHVLDNAVDTAVFRPDTEPRPEPGRFFAIAGWRSPKRPDLLLRALERLRRSGRDARLRIAGSGPMDASLRKLADELGLGPSVVFLGPLEPTAVAEEMRAAHALVHAADYETYSAVCAEALCCGTPVIASWVGGIAEYLDDGLGASVREATTEAWAAAWEGSWSRLLSMDRHAIAQHMSARAGMPAVGVRYAAILEQVIATAPHA